MAGINKVILIGNLGADPEIRHLPSGAAVANFSLATSESYTNKNGERVTQTEWHRIELWEGLAKIAEQYLKKVQPVYIEGKIKYENWQDQEGNNRTTTKIRGTNMQLLGGRGDDSQGSSYSAPQQQSQPQAKSSPQPVGNGVNPNVQAGEDEIDDLPF